MCFTLFFSFIQFTELEQLGHKGFAISFFNGNYNVAGSESVISALSSQHLDYLYALIFYGKQQFYQFLAISLPPPCGVGNLNEI